MSSLAQIARAIVERYFMQPGEQVRAVVERDADVLVDAGAIGWAVSAVDRPDRLEPSRHRLFEVRPDMDEDPPGPPEGLALLPDGAMFHLNEADDFRAYYRAVGDSLAAVELAFLLATYQAEGALHNLIVRSTDMERHVQPVELEAIPGFTAPSEERVGSRRYLRFCTYAVQQFPGKRPEILLTRWEAEARDGALDWRTQPLARLQSSGYS